jgi:hypothetical protein
MSSKPERIEIALLTQEMVTAKAIRLEADIIYLGLINITLNSLAHGEGR